jgi:hypothetical protein
MTMNSLFGMACETTFPILKVTRHMVGFSMRPRSRITIGS